MTKRQMNTSGSRVKGFGSPPKAKPMSTLIVSTPGMQAGSLRATLNALPSVLVIGSASGCLSALYMVRELKPDLLVIDSNLPTLDVQTLVKQIKREGLRTWTLVLTTARNQGRTALAAGADATFSRDASAEQLVALLAGLDGTNNLDGKNGTSSVDERAGRSP